MRAGGQNSATKKWQLNYNYFYELLTVLLEYINLYSHFLQVSIYKMEILTLKQLGLACLL